MATSRKGYGMDFPGFRRHWEGIPEASGVSRPVVFGAIHTSKATLGERLPFGISTVTASQMKASTLCVVSVTVGRL